MDDGTRTEPMEISTDYLNGGVSRSLFRMRFKFRLLWSRISSRVSGGGRMEV